MDGERQIAEEVETQLRKTLDMYEQSGAAKSFEKFFFGKKFCDPFGQQLDRENAAKAHLENDISRTTEVCLTEVGCRGVFFCLLLFYLLFFISHFWQ